MKLEDVLKPKSKKEILEICKKLLAEDRGDVIIKNMLTISYDNKDVEKIALNLFKNDKKINADFIYHIIKNAKTETNLFKEALKRIEKISYINDLFKISARRGFLDAVKFLLNEKNTDIHDTRDYALRWASYYNHANVVEYLLENGANKNAFREDELVKLAKRQNFEVLKILGYES